MGSLARKALRALQRAKRTPLEKMRDKGKAFEIVNGEPVNAKHKNRRR